MTSFGSHPIFGTCEFIFTTEMGSSVTSQMMNSQTPQGRGHGQVTQRSNISETVQDADMVTKEC